MKTAAVIVAAGRGTRAGDGLPKQWRPLAGETVATHAMRAFATHPKIDQVVLVLHPDDIDTSLWPRTLPAQVVAGGATRSASVLAGLMVLKDAFDFVLIHDAARPCVSRDVIDGVIDALALHRAAAPAIPVVDALWVGDGQHVTGTAARANLYRAQTPQGFHLSDIIAAHHSHPEGADDDVALARAAGHVVAMTLGDADNLKITTPGDFARAERILKARDGY